MTRQDSSLSWTTRRELASRLELLAHDDGKRLQLGTAAYRRCVRLFTTGRMVEQHERVLQDVSGTGIGGLITSSGWSFLSVPLTQHLPMPL